MRIRLRGPEGTTTLSIDDSATWHNLKTEISQKTNIADFDIRYGFPPKTLNTESIGPDTRLTDIEVKLDGEQLIILPRAIDLNKPLASTSSAETALKASHSVPGQPRQPLNLQRKNHNNVENDPPEVSVPNLDGIVVLRIMPDDNSCLFRALGTAVLGSSLDGMTELRSIIAQTIQAQPELYSEAILEKSPADYCRWIQREDSWGGGIELSILSQHFDIEIASINVQDLRVDKFNEGRPTRCILVYSGIHYDCIAVSPYSGADIDFDRKVIDVIRTGDEEFDGGALDAAIQLCRELQQRHYYTDTHGFSVKCNTCGTQGRGQKWAVDHAKDTGHTDFGEGS